MSDESSQVEHRAPGSTKELRAFLLEQMVEVASGRQAADSAKAICNYAQQVYNTINMELKVAQAKQRLGEAKVDPVDFRA